MGAIPAPGLVPDVATFHNNMLSTDNVFLAARRAGIKKLVYASSETVLGLPFDIDPPYAPVDEEYPAGQKAGTPWSSTWKNRWRSSSPGGIRR